MTKGNIDIDHQSKYAAVEQWSNDPCESLPGDRFQPGSSESLSLILQRRSVHAPWLDDVLAYGSQGGKDVLDVGCGQGIDVVKYARAGARVTGIDLTPRHVELARQHVASCGLDATIFQADAEDLPFEDASFDYVTSNGVLHHTPHFERAVHEIFRVLKPGGQTRIILYNRYSLHFLFEQLIPAYFKRRKPLAEVEVSQIKAEPLVTVLSRRQIKQALRVAGFSQPRTVVRHFNETDASVYDYLARRIHRLGDQVVRDRIGMVAGWYVVGIASKAMVPKSL